MMLFLLFLAIICTVIWLANYLQYQKYSFGYEDYGLCLGKTTEDYQYSLKYPGFASFTGNFAISNKNDTIGIIIWPKPFLAGNFEEYKTGLRIYDNDINHGYMFYVNSHMEYLPHKKNYFSEEDEAYIRKFLKENKNEINKMYSAAKKEWRLAD